MENHVFSGTAWIQFAHQFETNTFWDLDERELIVNKISIFGGTHSISQCIGSASHTSVRISRLDEVANVDELFSRNLVAYSWAHPILGRIVSHSGVLLKQILHIP